MADGASESGFAAIWAQLLVQDFVCQSAGTGEYWTERMNPLREAWLAEVERWRMESGGQPLPWHAKVKFQQGAFATFLGVTLGAVVEDNVPWEAVAVGDACLFQTHGNEMLSVFPLKQSREFNNRPKLVGSRAPSATVRDQLSKYRVRQRQIGRPIVAHHRRPGALVPFGTRGL